VIKLGPIFDYGQYDKIDVLDGIGFMFSAGGYVYYDTIRKTNRRSTLAIL
jgi:hypothetical protein